MDLFQPIDSDSEPLDGQLPPVQRLLLCRAKIVRHGRYVVFQMAEVAVPKHLFADILRRIDRLRPSKLRHEQRRFAPPHRRQDRCVRIPG
jgi:hypothetical protein